MNMFTGSNFSCCIADYLAVFFDRALRWNLRERELVPGADGLEDLERDLPDQQLFPSLNGAFENSHIIGPVEDYGAGFERSSGHGPSVSESPGVVKQANPV